MSLSLVHVELKEANDFVAQHHRHHKPMQGHRFSLGAENENGELVGVAIVGRPVGRMIDKSQIVEVNRLCTDGTFNACSFLYGAAAKAAKCLGYREIWTYILAEEPGTSLKAAGWTNDGQVRKDGVGWNNRAGRRKDQPQGPKHRWRKALR